MLAVCINSRGKTMDSITLRILRDEHFSLTAVLRSLRMMPHRGPGEDAPQYFDAMRAMLFYIDEVPEKEHHPKESQLLFQPMLQRMPELAQTLQRLEGEHAGGEKAVGDLQYLLLAWELMGDDRREAFAGALGQYIDFYLEHMSLEETVIFPAAQKAFTPGDWAAIDGACAPNRDPPAPGAAPDPACERLFSRIVRSTPSPIGLGMVGVAQV